jgi:hypothetical protein
LSGFKQSIDDSLHESERTRCLDEILLAVLDRVDRVCALRKEIAGDNIEGDTLVDDRAPVFESVNKKWGLKYSPGLFDALEKIAERCWDSLGCGTFDRFWDYGVESLAALIMKVENGQEKRMLLHELNDVVVKAMTPAISGDLIFSLAFVQLSGVIDEIQNGFASDFTDRGLALPIWIVPKSPYPQAEDTMDSTRKRHRVVSKSRQRTPVQKGRVARRGKQVEDERAKSPDTEAVERVYGEMKWMFKNRILAELKKGLTIFEALAGEGEAVGEQLTRNNVMDSLDTNLDAEVDDDLIM